MAQVNTQNIYAQYVDSEVSITPFATARMGILTGQTVLHIETYNIICVPYRMSMKSATMMASFSREEFLFFQKYLNGMSGLTIKIQPTASPQPIKVFARCIIKSIAPIPGRDSIGFISLEWKPCPPDFIGIIGDYLMLQDRLKTEYEDFKNQKIPINPESVKLMGYNNFADLIHEGKSTHVAVFLISTGSVNFLVPVSGPALEPGKEAQIKLFFKSYQFSVAGKITESLKLPNGAQKVAMELSFSAELTDIIEKFRFAEQINAKK